MKIFFTIAILFFSSYLFAQDDKTFDLVISKLKNDTKSYEQFAELGKIYCSNMHISKSSDLFVENYSKLFNSFYPFPRLIEQDALEKQYEISQKKIKQNKCSCFYSTVNKELKVLYVKLIQNKMSFHNNEDYYLEEDMKDYLKGYMIDGNRFK